MKESKKDKAKNTSFSGEDFIKRLGEDGWTYIRTVVDVVREPILIIGKDFRVMAANESFLQMFQVAQKDTEGKIVYDLGNGQWNIPSLRKLLEDILPKNTFFKGFEVDHNFPLIGRKVMILNAREIYCKEDPDLEPCPPIILLAIEDVTDMMGVAEMLSRHTNEFEEKMVQRTEKLEAHIVELQKQVLDSKQR